MQFQLGISRVSGAIAMEQAGVGVVRGGPRELLDWLETQLALGPPDESEPHQTAAYARWIDAAGVAEIAESVAADRWETAAELLRRRDALRIGGWDGGSIDVDSPVVQALVAIEAAGREMDGGEAARICRLSERLDEIGRALDAGQMLPSHRVVLLEPLDAWPWRWQRVIERLSYGVAEAVDAHASPATSLGRIQRALAAGEVADVPPDASIAWVEASGAMSAVELVASVLRTDGGRGSVRKLEPQGASRGIRRAAEGVEPTIQPHCDETFSSEIDRIVPAASASRLKSLGPPLGRSLPVLGQSPTEERVGGRGTVVA